jgi:hypothetical protein
VVDRGDIARGVWGVLRVCFLRNLSICQTDNLNSMERKIPLIPRIPPSQSGQRALRRAHLTGDDVVVGVDWEGRPVVVFALATRPACVRRGPRASVGLYFLLASFSQ